MNLIEYNKKFQNAACPTCDAWRGDPCRTSRWKVRQPHPARVKLVKAMDTVEASLGAIDSGKASP